jgi:acyl-ACP thioesterase
VSAIDIEKNRESKKLKKTIKDQLSPLDTKKKKHFSKLRNMIKKKKQGKL